jgi:CBS domain-containing protein
MDRNPLKLPPNMDLAEAMTALTQSAASCALIMEAEHLVGLLTRENLSEFVTLRRFGLNARNAA